MPPRSNSVQASVKPPKYPCPCDDVSLCAPLSPQPPIPRDEVVAFTSWVFGGEQPLWRNTSKRVERVWTASEHLDFRKITTLAPFDDINVAGPYHQAYAKNGNNTDYAKLWCEAKRSNTRILTWGHEGWDGNSCPVTEFYSWLRGSDTGGEGTDPRIYNKSAVLEWARVTAECVPLRGFDGVLLDIEGVHVPTQKERSAITFAVCALKRALNATLPGHLLAWTTDTGNYFDYAEMTKAGCVDLWLDMAYSWCVTAETHSALRNRANAPMPFLTGPGSIIDTYTSRFGVPLQKLGILLPWYGCAFDCSGTGEAYGGCPTTPAFANTDARTTTFGDIVEHFLPNATTPPTLNASSVTKVLNYRNASGTLHQLWYDDAETLTRKYAAIKAAGVGAIGMWTADATNNASVATALWDAVPLP
jgi:hypothetical protein